MKLGKDCFPCIISNFLKLLSIHQIPAEKEENLLRHFLTYLASADYEVSPPVFGREMHRMIRKQLNNNDPYASIKKHYNQLMLNNYVHFKNMIEKAGNPYHMALRLAIAGNVIDFGSQQQFDIAETLERITFTNPSIDDSQDLWNSLRKAQTLLYIGDNCGEIVLDKLFLETIAVPNKYFAVRGQPVLNDITLEDAKFVGIDKIGQLRPFATRRQSVALGFARHAPWLPPQGAWFRSPQATSSVSLRSSICLPYSVRKTMIRSLYR